MSFEDEKREALTILEGIVDGEMTTDESFRLLDAADPTLVYFIFKWIKKYYHRDRDGFEVVRGRLSALTNSYRALTRKAKAGETDSVVEWFEGSYKYRDLTAEEFIDLVVEKLEA